MTQSNRVRVSVVREVTPGTTPNTPRMRTMRITGESLVFNPSYTDSDELRDDRMLGDPIRIMQESGGSINFELSYPEDLSPLSEAIRSAFYNTWVNTPTFDNDGTADSVVTDAGTVADTYGVVSGGAAVVVGHLVRATGFTQAANNQIFRAASSSATTIAGTGLGLVANAAPAATAKLKVVGFQGASGDITAAAGGLASTALNFTTLGLSVGQWLKIGGTAVGDRFTGTPANNDWVRISGAITATAIPLDNLPTGWAVDAGAGKTIKVWFGDTIKNGVLQTALSVEKGFLGQTVPTYIVNRGMTANVLNIAITSRQKITGSVDFTGMGGQESTTSLDAVPDAATTNAIMAANANVGRLAEGGSPLVAKNWGRSLTFSVNNNQRTIEDVAQASPVAVNEGECTVTGRLESYFGDDVILAKFYGGTPTSLNSRVVKNSQAMIFQFPRAVYRGGGNPQATGKNTDVLLPLDFQAAIDTATNSQIIMDRVPYYE